MTRPNILIVMADHQRADTVTEKITPNLQRLAENGVRFTNCFCPTPHCCPSRATFHSGLYPSKHGVWNNILNDQAINRNLNPGVKLWSEDLRDAGYDMYFSGKWHVEHKRTPADFGWKELFVSATNKDIHSKTWERYRKEAPEYKDCPKGRERKPGELSFPGYGIQSFYGTMKDVEKDHDWIATEKTIEKLTELTSSEDQKPWCVFTGFFGPHDPYFAPREYLDRFPIEEIELPESYGDEFNGKPYIYKRISRQVFGQLSQDEVKEAIRHYRACCAYLDDRFGKMLDIIDNSKDAENTLVLYISDHADYCGEHGLFVKGVPCFRGAYNVPAVMRWPGKIKNPGRKTDALLSLADFGPTFLEAANIQAERDFTGESLMPFLENRQAENWRDAVFTQMNGVELYYSQRSVMTKDYKYTFNGFDRDELYDLKKDPDEMNNLADDPSYDKIKHELCRKMWKFALKEKDSMINNYLTVALVPYGPSEAFL